jgi:2-C-methyl-D-erythritol 4-phosphate cytidylyltransferase
MFVSAIIAAGGRGVRAKGELPKQFVDLGGKTMVELTVEALMACSCIEEIVVAIPEKGDSPLFRHLRSHEGHVGNEALLVVVSTVTRASSNLARDGSAAGPRQTFYYRPIDGASGPEPRCVFIAFLIRLETATRAIDAGVQVSKVADDFDGLPRTVGNQPDAGAFELQARRQH